MRKAYSILAVAVTTSACSGSVAPSEQQQLAVESECPTQLNEQLSYITLDSAIADYKTYRPICDKDGYPLCGNLNGKVVATASEFCAALRDKNLLR
jgi:hypothetical protein